MAYDEAVYVVDELMTAQQNMEKTIDAWHLTDSDNVLGTIVNDTEIYTYSTSFIGSFFAAASGTIRITTIGRAEGSTGVYPRNGTIIVKCSGDFYNSAADLYQLKTASNTYVTTFDVVAGFTYKIYADLNTSSGYTVTLTSLTLGGTVVQIDRTVGLIVSTI